MKIELLSKNLLTETNLQLSTALAKHELGKLNDKELINEIVKIKDVSLEQAIRIDEAVYNADKKIMFSTAIRTSGWDENYKLYKELLDDEFIKNNKVITEDIQETLTDDSLVVNALFGKFEAGTELTFIQEWFDSDFYKKYSSKIASNNFVIREVV